MNLVYIALLMIHVPKISASPPVQQNYLKIGSYDYCRHRKPLIT
jgi:hypothetical protein